MVLDEGTGTGTETEVIENETEIVKEEEKTPEQITKDAADAEAKADKTAIQKRFDQLTYERRKAETERDRLLSIIEKNQGKEKEEPVKDPTTFATIEEYTDYLVEKKMSEKMAIIDHKNAQSAAQRMAETKIQSFNTKAAAFLEKNPDFYDVINDPLIETTTIIQDALIESENGPDVAYYLAKNPAELAKLNNMTPYQQVLALGKIEAKLSSGDKIVLGKSTKSLPEPLNTVKGGVKMDDGPSDKDSIEVWMAKEKARLKKIGKIK